MSKVEPETWSGAARYHVALRRRYQRWKSGGILCALALMALLVLQPPMSRASVVLGGSLLIGFLGCWFGSLASWLALLGFRCPRCGHRFLAWNSRRPASNCQCCSLPLG